MCIKGRAVPWVYELKIAMRPAGAKALIINAFAPAGRIVICDTFTQGVCPGLCASAPLGRAALTFDALTVIPSPTISSFKSYNSPPCGGGVGGGALWGVV